jgi:tol-pal system protein YbgF
MRAGRLLLLACALAGLGGCSLTRPEEEPAYVKATAVEGRVNRIERQNDALLDMQRQLEALQAEVRRLRGELDQATHEAESSKAQQRDLYTDLDRRLQALDARLQGTPSPGGAAGAGGAGGATGAAGDREAYQAALDKLKKRDYPGAEKALGEFLASYPQSTLADNAQYWLGEACYVERRYPEAVEHFMSVVRDHPQSRKVPDALLKAGYARYEQKQLREARDLLTRVVKSYPDSSAATEARERLRRMDAAGR